MIDLHAHSTCSDGSLSPSALVELAASKGLSALALTDHDTVSGVAEASRECSRRGIQFVPGVELEVDYQGGEFHLLGLGLRKSPEKVEIILTDLKRRRHRRNLGIVEKMRGDGVEVDLNAVAAFAGGEVLGRPHFAHFLVDRGIASTIQDAFDRFLGRDQRYFLAIEHLTVDQCAQIIASAGGRTVIAHPLSLGLSLDGFERRLGEWKQAGVQGIEAYHPNAPLDTCRELESIAARAGMFVTAGSDFHGSHRKDRNLGYTAGGLEIADRFLAGLD
ncbi:MAG TPA: PHP domain-containing protein [Spirochaetia bacterium]|nr:PHP domain-containing protein [Spirochaetia bacterium]